MAEFAKRCRMNLAQNAKGKFQLDITAEYETPEESARMLADAIDRANAVVAQKGLQLVTAD